MGFRTQKLSRSETLAWAEVKTYQSGWHTFTLICSIPCGHCYVWTTVRAMNLKDSLMACSQSTELLRWFHWFYLDCSAYPRLCLPLQDKDQGGNGQNLRPHQPWQWRDGWTEPQGLLPMAAALHKHQLKNSREKLLETKVCSYFWLWISIIYYGH